MNIRRARLEDIPQIQACNLECLPENYTVKYYIYHLMTWPHMSYVAEVDSYHHQSDGPCGIDGYGLLEASNTYGSKDQLTSNGAVHTGNKKMLAGYVLVKMEEDAVTAASASAGSSLAADKQDTIHAHITSLAVRRPWRRTGLAEMLMRQAEVEMRQVYRVPYVSLNEMWIECDSSAK